MAELQTSVSPPGELSATDRDAMFAIMDQVYDGMTRRQFETDLAAKDEVIVLRDGVGELVGFSTQRLVEVELGGEQVSGVFSGDTVIRPDHWGGAELFQAFARRYIIERIQPWYWFLICKGHRTYRMLPTFFTEFWPTRRAPTPAREQAIMDAYASSFYGEVYDQASGVLAYPEQKDRLRDGVAAVTEQLLRNPEVAFFVEQNPGHVLGHDLVCLAELSPDRLRPAHRRRLLGHP